MTNDQLAQAIQDGDTSLLPALYEQIYKLFAMLADKQYKRFADRFEQCGIMPEDLRQECYFVLLRMLSAYDRTKGFQFTSYINYQLSAHIRHLLHLQDGKCAQTDLLVTSASLDKPIDSMNGEGSMLDLIPDPASDPTASIEQVDYIKRLHEDLEQCITGALTPRQQSIVRAYYFKGDNFPAIAKSQRVRISYVASEHRQALKRLKRSSHGHKLARQYDMILVHAYEGKDPTARTVELMEKFDLLD